MAHALRLASLAGADQATTQFLTPISRRDRPDDADAGRGGAAAGAACAVTTGTPTTLGVLGIYLRRAVTRAPPNISSMNRQ